MDVARVIKAVLAGALAVLTGILVWSGLGETRRLERARGAVLRLESQRDSDGDLLYAPVVEFHAGGGAYTVVGEGSKPALYDPSETVDVLYDPGDPTHAKLDSWVDRWLVALMAGVAAIACAAAAGLPLRGKRQRYTGYALVGIGGAALLASELVSRADARVMFPLGFALIVGALAFLFGERRDATAAAPAAPKSIATE